MTNKSTADYDAIAYDPAALRERLQRKAKADDLQRRHVEALERQADAQERTAAAQETLADVAMYKILRTICGFHGEYSSVASTIRCAQAAAAQHPLLAKISGIPEDLSISAASAAAWEKYIEQARERQAKTEAHEAELERVLGPRR